ncbi:hypothetical protein JAAARDRAFT_70311 [Jaapia argillacea MUCL 33604]|uniref:F-box domain-containing protein n=1 Tax=Jaapia argillacea MUCL 33604 TaxID=933084 RepID=A0A067PZ84_9AGAM|nr:hypothetical protein JAAARDRAFT_70311 [Jaapia argillacea MUCL 33604]
MQPLAPADFKRFDTYARRVQTLYLDMREVPLGLSLITQSRDAPLLPSLQAIHLYKKGWITWNLCAERVRAAASLFLVPTLRSLDMSGTPRTALPVTDFLVDLPRECPHLEELIYEPGIASSLAFMGQLSQLRSLEICGMCGLVDTDFESLSRLRGLRSLTLYDLFAPQSSPSPPVTSSFSSLQYLTIANGNAQGVSRLLQMASTSPLQSLDIKWLKLSRLKDISIPISALLPFAESLVTLFISVGGAQNEIVRVADIRGLTKLHSLQTLYLFFPSNIQLGDIEAMGQAWPVLRNLLLRDMSMPCSFRHLAAFAAHFPSLRELDIDSLVIDDGDLPSLNSDGRAARSHPLLELKLQFVTWVERPVFDRLAKAILSIFPGLLRVDPCMELNSAVQRWKEVQRIRLLMKKGQQKA